MKRLGKISFWPILYLVIFLLSISISCTHEPEDFGLNDTICFDTQVLPLLQNSCGISGCHDVQSAEEGFIAVDYESILKAVKPGEPRQSKLYSVLTDIWSEHFMPPDKPLTPEQRNIIQLWIAQGAMNTVCETTNPIGNGEGNENPDPIDYGDSICFVQNILPVFLSSCGTTGCHDAATHKDGYTLIDYTSIMSDNEGIIPNNPGESKFYKVVTEDEPGDIMPPPPRTPLTTEQIANLRKWIEDGALNSDCPDSSCDTSDIISFSTQVYPILQKNCTSCHSSTLANGGVKLNNYANVQTTAEAERSGISILTGSIRGLNDFADMPPNNQLDECSIRIIELWIQQGVLNN